MMKSMSDIFFLRQVDLNLMLCFSSAKVCFPLSNEGELFSLVTFYCIYFQWHLETAVLMVHQLSMTCIEVIKFENVTNPSQFFALL